jgi:hypothetical protein
LKPFWEVTKRLEGHAKTGTYGVIWEALLALDLLLDGIEKYLRTHGHHPDDERPSIRRRTTTVSTPPINPLIICYQNAWEVLRFYNDLTDKNHEIYAAAALLNPCLRKSYFNAAWTGDAASFIEPMIQKNRGIWETQYRQNNTTRVSEEPQSSFSAFIAERQGTLLQATEDEFSRYINDRPLRYKELEKQGLFKWWMESEYTQLRQWAFDTLSIPAMSAELERVFSQSKRAFGLDRHRLLTTTFEAQQCLKHWLDQGLYRIGNSTASGSE